MSLWVNACRLINLLLRNSFCRTDTFLVLSLRRPRVMLISGRSFAGGSFWVQMCLFSLKYSYYDLIWLWKRSKQGPLRHKCLPQSPQPLIVLGGRIGPVGRTPLTTSPRTGCLGFHFSRLSSGWALHHSHWLRVANLVLKCPGSAIAVCPSSGISRSA
jgi:hypothetical protein